MAINADVQEALNTQIKNELHSFYRYLSAAAYFETKTPYYIAQLMILSVSSFALIAHQ